VSKIETDEKNSVEPMDFEPTRRDMLRIAGHAAAAGALTACGGDEMMMPLPQSCPGVVATGAESLAVNKAMRFDKMPTYMSFIVARDSQGFYALANACPHSGCQTSFNESAMSFDCPCHGSRFKFDGSLLNGPAATAMKAYTICRRADNAIVVDNSEFVIDRTQRVK